MTHRTRASLLAALVASVAQAAPAASQLPRAAAAPRAPAQAPYVVRIGYTSWENTLALSGESAFESVKWYLEEVARRSPDKRRQLRFEVAAGNYYQILAWFRAGTIDAAIVSPFSAYLLERDGQALSVLEFAEGPVQQATGTADGSRYEEGHDPVVSVSRAYQGSPTAALNTYLNELLAAAQDSPAAERKRIEELRQRFRFDLVAHLSSSAFVMPTLYAKQWLEAHGHLEAEVKRRFWRRYFENAHLTLTHGREPADPPVATIRFGYRTGAPLGDRDFPVWEKYRVAAFDGEPLRIPNDVLVLRHSVAEEALAEAGFDRARLGELLADAALREDFCRRGGTYSAVRWFDPQVQGAFRNEVHRLLSADSGGELARLDRRWYRSGLFDFTIDETMGLLRQDQANSGVSRLAVVLSGGGVKSLYQTVLLDRLYRGGAGSPRQLRNYDEGPEGGVGAFPSVDAKSPLTVHTLIGTSGGAMLAFFAAQLPKLEALQNIVERTAERPLFPLADLPRLFSLLVLLAVVYAVLLVARIFDIWQLRSDSINPVKKDGAARVVVTGVLLALAGAFAIVATRSQFSETVPWSEGLFYVLTGVVVHFCLTCIVKRPDQRLCDPRLARVSSIGMAFGVLLVVIAICTRYLIGPAPAGLHELQLPVLSTLASAGVFLIAAAFASGAAAGRWGLRVQGLHDYRMAWIAISALIALPLGALTLLAWLDVATLLELTGHYWIFLLVAAVAVALGIARYSLPKRTTPQRLLRGGLVQLMRQREGVVTTTMGSTMLGVFALCILCWGTLVAPAVYSNVNAVLAFSTALPDEKLATGRFRTNLVVTGTLLRERRCLGQEAVPGGGLYFCFEGAEGCGLPALRQWQVFPRPVVRRAVDAVFASGSAFPVFPPHRAHLPNGCEVRLVDGGYAHNVPLEAAAMSRARQVLILNASPDPLADADALVPAGSWLRKLQLGGQLVRSSPELLSFMFARAQDLDRSIGSDMLVASLTPRPDPQWPFLLDFRKSARRRVLDAAVLDLQLDQRIGSVLSWGKPVLVPLEGQAFPPLTDEPRLDALLRPAIGARHAAFDLDNTSLRGDIGDALLLKLVVEMAYHGERDDLWALFPNPAARRELRRYWHRLHAQPVRPYAQPAEWGPELTDYVVLFLRQYEQLLAGPDGKRVAYPWVVKLMAGMTADDVNRHLAELWKTEMARPETPLELVSQRYGTYTVDGGIRVRREIAQYVAQLQASGWEVWIVTASNVYAGRYAAHAFGVPADHVLGITPLPEGGGNAAPEGQARLSMEVAQPVPYREGKVAALRAHGVRARLAAGDSDTDFEMLADAEVAILVDRGKIPEVDLLGRNWIRRAPGSFRTQVYDPLRPAPSSPRPCGPRQATTTPALSLPPSPAQAG